MQVEFVRETGQHGHFEEHWIPREQERHYAAVWRPDRIAASDAAPIVLFHDSLGCVALWRDFPAALSAATGRAVIAYDRPGFGRSSPHPGGWTSNFIQEEGENGFLHLQAALGIDRYVALGHSVGGAMAASCAAMNPQRCEALITLSAPAFVDANMRRGLCQARQDFGKPGQIERLARYHGDKANWVLSTWIDTWLSSEFAHWRIEQVAPDLDCRHLVIHGDRDEYGLLNHHHRLAGLTKGPVEQLIINDCGHVPHRECPEIVVQAVSRFLSSSLQRCEFNPAKVF